MPFKYLLSVLVLMFSGQVFAISLSGTGYGHNEQEAKNHALGDLAANISSQVKKHVQSITTEQGRASQVDIDVYSNLPINNPKFSFGDNLGQKEVIASISTANSLQSYISELNRLRKNIASLENTSDYKLLAKLKADVHAFNQNKIVASLLNDTEQTLPDIDITEADVLKRFRKLEKNVVSLEQAGAVLTKGIEQNSIYILAPKPNQSEDITPFSRQLKAQMSKHLKLVNSPTQARYLLRGRYEISPKNLFVTVQLFDQYNRVVKTNTVRIQSTAYSGIAYKPKNSGFDQEVAHVPKYAGDLAVKIGFRGFNTQDSIDLQQGKTVDLVVKANQSICYYLVGHILHEEEKLSYLIPMVDGSSPFINRITGSDVNRSVVVLKGLEVSPPFGRESLQIFASTLGKNGMCPLTPPGCENNSEGYCVISGKPSVVVSKTRGLMTKKQTGNYKTQKAEAILNFTTH